MEPYLSLEKEFASRFELEHTVACSSGTTALQLALEAFNLPLGSSVLVPEFTMIACARAVTMAGLRPIFVDCGDDLLMRPDLLVQRSAGDTVAVMPVHIYGRLCNMSHIGDIAKAMDWKVIEDCAEVHGASGLQQPKPNGAQCWSFYRNKIVAGEEGGMIAFYDSKPANLATMLRSHGFTSQHNFMHIPRGINARLSNAHASIVLHSLSKLDRNLVKRRTIEAWYSDRIPAEWRMPAREAVWVYDLLLPVGANSEEVTQDLNSAGIPARCGFKPMSMQPEYYHPGYIALNAYRLSKRVLYLPCDPSLTEDDVDRICAALMHSVEAAPV